MKVRYIAHLDDIDLTEGAIYKVLSIEKNWYRIVDDLKLQKTSYVKKIIVSYEFKKVSVLISDTFS